MQKFGRSVIVGIVSWGMDCGSQVYPGVYARVFQHLQWYLDRIPAKDLCS